MDEDAETSPIIDTDGRLRQGERRTAHDVTDALFATLGSRSRFNKRALRRSLCPGMSDVDFGLAFQRAVDRARDELKRVFVPQQHVEAGLYVLANAKQRLSRGSHQIQAANKKMIRAVRTIAIQGPPLDFETARQRTELLERASFQMARRSLQRDESPITIVVAPCDRPARPPVVQEISGYPVVPPRSR